MNKFIHKKTERLRSNEKKYTAAQLIYLEVRFRDTNTNDYTTFTHDIFRQLISLSSVDQNQIDLLVQGLTFSILVLIFGGF